MEKEKQRQYQMMQTRICKLKIDQDRANKELRRSIDFHDKLEQVQKRKQDDFEQKSQWLASQYEQLKQQRMKNLNDRESRRNGMMEGRRRVFYNNWSLKQRIKDEN